MRDESCNKIRLLRVWELLKTETDEENPMGTTEIITRLEAEGLKCNRTTLYDDIALLNKYGYEIQCTRSVSNKYYVSNRDFDVPEIQILIDAVQAASFITAKKTPVFVNKLAQLAGTQKAEVLKKNIVEFGTVKGDNEVIYYSIDEITNAITQGKKIAFNYFDYGIGKKKVYRMNPSVLEEIRTYVVNPVATVFYDDKYYLICYLDKYLNLTQFRIDRMEKVKMLDEAITPNKELKKKDIAKHKSSLFDMFGGEKTEIVFEASTSVLDSIYDRFGDNVKVARLDDNKVLCTVKVQVGRPLIAWFIGFGESLKVKSPQSVVDSIKTLLNEAAENYRVPYEK